METMLLHGSRRVHAFERPSVDEVAVAWLEYGPRSSTSGTASTRGRPWGFWQFDGVEPRRVVRGAELLAPKRESHDWTWVWRSDYGWPAFRQVRPRGFTGRPSVEAQAQYLKRQGLLTASDRAELGAAAFEPEDVDPFVATSEGIDQLLAIDAGRQRRTHITTPEERHGHREEEP
jgi:hypothetical protein